MLPKKQKTSRLIYNMLVLFFKTTAVSLWLMVDGILQAAATPKTPRLPPPPPSAMSETTDVGAAERQESLTPPASGSGGSAHRRTTSWGGSPTASGAAQLNCLPSSSSIPSSALNP